MTKPKLQTHSMGSTEISRRTLLSAGAATALAAPFLSIPGRVFASGRIVVSSWGGKNEEVQREVFHKSFTDETGIEVVITGAPNPAKLTAQFQNDAVEVDVIETFSGMIAPGEKAGIFAPVDTNIVDMSQAIEQARRKYQVGWYTYAGGIAYDPTRHSGEQVPGNWADFWDVEKFPGRRALRPRVSENLEIAAMASGVAPDQVYPIDVDRAFDQLDKIKNHITHWTKATAQTIALVQQDEVDFSYTYSGRAFASQSSAVPLDMVFNQNYVGIGRSAAMAKSPNPEGAQMYLNHLMDAGRQAEFARLIGFGPTINAAMNGIPEDTRKWLVDLSDTQSNCIEDVDWWRDEFDALNKRFTEWRLT